MQTRRTNTAFTLIELLIVVAIISILAVIAVYNMRLAAERARKSADMANLRTIGTALQTYLIDYNVLPPGDNEAGPFMSHDRAATGSGNGPAAGGSWSGVPWLLVELGYISDSRTLFTPKYLALYPGGSTIRGNYPRYHNFRYAYNSASIGNGGQLGGNGRIMSGEVWLVRNLFVPPESGFYGASYPRYPADYRYPWGEGDWEGKLEHALYADMAVRTVIGGTNKIPDPTQAPTNP
ncbi:prepilin-type N-terminal cleavage/methylation domain-containing protein [bacterium]|nr:prepilin-type N-terminal cleavage/methylation domain-containing protein [bacterium]